MYTSEIGRRYLCKCLGSNHVHNFPTGLQCHRGPRRSCRSSQVARLLASPLCRIWWDTMPRIRSLLRRNCRTQGWSTLYCSVVSGKRRTGFTSRPMGASFPLPRTTLVKMTAPGDCCYRVFQLWRPCHWLHPPWRKWADWSVSTTTTRGWPRKPRHVTKSVSHLSPGPGSCKWNGRSGKLS